MMTNDEMISLLETAPKIIDTNSLYLAAKHFGAKSVGYDIRWDYAHDFLTPEHGQLFVSWLDVNEVENNGYWPVKHCNGTDFVRFRL